MVKRIALTLVALIVLSATANAQPGNDTIYNWSGTINNLWETVNNWNPTSQNGEGPGDRGLNNNANGAAIPLGSANSALMLLDLSGNRSLGRIHLQTGTGSLVEIANGSGTAGTLRLNSNAGSFLINDSVGNLAISNTNGGNGALTLELIGTAGIGLSVANGGIFISANITGTGNVTITNSSADTGSTGSGYGTKSGVYRGAVALFGSTSHTGTTTVSSGYLNVGNLSALSNTSSITVQSGGQLQLGRVGGGTYNLGTGTLTLNGNGPASAAQAGALTIGNSVDGFTSTVTNNISLASDTIINARGANNVLALTGDISGAGALTKRGDGSLQLGGVGSYGGATNIQQGTLQLTTGNNRLPTGTTVNLGRASNSSLGTLDLNGFNQSIVGLNSISGTNASSSKNTVTSSSAATLTLTGSGSTAFGDGSNANSGVITGAISVVKSGSGTQTLGDLNSYSGTTTISGGTLIIQHLANGGSASGIGSSSNAASNLVIDGGTLQYTGGTASSDRRLTLGVGGATLNASGSGAMTLSSTDAVVMSGSGPRTFTLTGTNTGANTFAGSLSDSGGSTSLTKNGAGTWVLTGTSGHTGDTTINAGTLVVNGQLTNSLANVTVGTLRGSGTIESVQIANGATLAPGDSNSVGTMTVKNQLAFSAGGNLSLRLNGATVGSYDQITVDNGTVALNSAELLFTLDPGYTPVNYVDSLKIIDMQTGTLTGTFNNLPDNGAPFSMGGFNWKIYYGASADAFGGTDGNDVVIVPVPEPAHVLLLASAAAAGIAFIRRRLRRPPLAA